MALLINICQCGCGVNLPDGRLFVRNHQVRLPSVRLKLADASRRMWATRSEEMCKLIAAKKAEKMKGDSNPAKRIEVRLKMSLASRGHHWNKGVKQSTEWKHKNRLAHLGKKASDDTKAKMSLAAKRRTKLNDEGRRQQAEKMSGSNNPASRPEIRSKILRSLFAGPNKAEQLLRTILNKYFPRQWKFVGNGKVIIGGKCPDFININGQKFLIELYGNFWHRNDDPNKRIRFFAGYGYNTVVIWERELKDQISIVRRIETELP